MAHPKLQMVRARYAFCCGYCGVSEADVGGELTVDHEINWQLVKQETV
jgi:hypothetical protein